MKNELDNKYIENAINELEESFGIKEEICGEKIFSLIRAGKIKESVEIIARQIGLPIRINIIKVPNNYRAQSNDNKFYSSHLVKTNQSGSGGGIVAQVIMPDSLPFYGSTMLNDYPISIKISENCTDCPVAFSMIMAHELSHVLLRSLCHEKKENEFYTDLIAIILGFETIFKNGRKIITTEEEFETIKTTTTTYGYLSDSQFDFAISKITTILKKNRERKNELFKDIKLFKKTLSKYKVIIFKFSKFIEYLFKNHNKNISGEDGKRMITFFQPDYMDNLKIIINDYEKRVNEMEIFYGQLFHYTDQRLKQLEDFIKKSKEDINDLKNKLIFQKQDIKILEKYIGILYRIKTSFFSLISTKEDKK